MGMHSFAFCELGIVLNSIEDIPVLKKYQEEHYEDEEYPPGLEDLLFELSQDDPIDLEIMDGLDIYRDQFVIGLPPYAMEPDETYNQFAERVVNNLKKLGIDVTVDQLDWLCDGGYEG